MKQPAGIPHFLSSLLPTLLFCLALTLALPGLARSAVRDADTAHITVSLVVGKTTAAEVNKVLRPSVSVPNKAVYKLFRQNAVINVHITEANGMRHTRVLDLRADEFHKIVLIFVRGKLMRYVIE